MNFGLNKNRIKLKNSGFSLVELMVAIAIFAIVAVPLLYSFIVAQRVTNKSHDMGEVTLVSRNIIETIKARGVWGIVNDIKDPSVPDPFSPADIDDFDDSVEGVYTFTISGIEGGSLGLSDISVSNTMLYDAVVTIEASAVYNPFNTEEMSDYSSMDAMFVQPRGIDEDPDELAVLEFQNEIYLLNVLSTPDEAPLPPPVDPDTEVRGMYSRTITLNVEQTGDNVSMTVAFDYEMMHPVHGVLTFSEEFDMYYEKYDDNPINAYLFYRPYYAQAPTDDTEVIIISNPDMIDLTVFVVKQRPIGMDDTNYTSYIYDENQYRAKIIRQESMGMFTGSGSEPKTLIYTNITDNFAGGSVNTSHFRNRVFYGWFTGDGFVKVAEFAGSATDGLISKSSRNRMYNVIVDIYNESEAGFGNLLFTYTAANLE